MAFREFQKNTRESLRVAANRYMGHDLINVRVYSTPPGGGEQVPTKKGISINVDLVPDLIDALKWAMGQPCTESSEEPEGPPLGKERDEELAQRVFNALRGHGVAVHWDTVERMIVDTEGLGGFSKWDLHYVLVSRDELFEHMGGGCFRARGDSEPRN